MEKIPRELWMEIIQYCDIKTLSSLQCADKCMYSFVKSKKYEMIDKMNIKLGNNIPKNKLTYDTYKYIIDFDELIMRKNELDDNVIIEFEDIINFSLLSNMQKLSEQILRRYYNKMSVNDIINNQTLPYDVLQQLILSNDFDANQWYILCKGQRFDVPLVEQYIEKVDWHALSQNKHAMTREFMLNYSDKLYWIEVSNLGICEDLILRYFDKINNRIIWNNITFASKLSIGFIKQFLHLFVEYDCIMALLSCQKVDEEIVDKILVQMPNGHTNIWKKISSYQYISKEFVIKYKEQLPIRLLKKNTKVPRKVLHEVFG